MLHVVVLGILSRLYVGFAKLPRNLDDFNGSFQELEHIVQFFSLSLSICFLSTVRNVAFSNGGGRFFRVAATTTTCSVQHAAPSRWQLTGRGSVAVATAADFQSLLVIFMK